MTTVRVGVTGHRDLGDPVRVTSDVDHVLERLGAGGTVDLVCVSSLAEGADRVVAQRVLGRRGGRLEVVLPLEADDYATDFAASASREMFNDLLVAADQVRVVPPDPADPSREAAYERAGLAMLDDIDVLIALWDGEPAQGRGGTAEIVDEARRRGIQVEDVRVQRGSS